MAASGARNLPAPESWIASGPRPSALLRLHRHSLAHVLVMGGTAERRAAMARAFHVESPLRAGPFLCVDCGHDEPAVQRAIRCWLSSIDRHSSDNPLRASERGTLFLDRIEELSEETQRLLLALVRAHASGVSDAWAGRLATGSAVELERAVAGGRFLSSLFDCLDKVRIVLGPQPLERPS